MNIYICIHLEETIINIFLCGQINNLLTYHGHLLEMVRTEV